MRFRFHRPRLAAVALLTMAVLPISGPSGIAGPNPEPSGTQSIHIPLRDVATDRSAVREVRSDMAFELIGFTWEGPAPDRVEVRTRAAEGWGPWTSLEAEGGGSEPMWTGRSNDVRVRATAQGQDVTGRLRFIGIDPGEQTTPPQASEPRAGKPPVISRAQWGADESKMTWPAKRTSIKAAVVHHTAGTNDYTCDQSAKLVRGIYQYHAVELGWGDIGYHALVDKCGTVFEGRTGGLAGNVSGGHVLGFNRNTFGISMMGNYDGATPSSKTVNAVADVVAWKLKASGVPADGTTRLTSEKGSKYPAGAVVTLPTIFGHRDVANTACPGQRGYDRLGAIRNRASDLQSAASR